MQLKTLAFLACLIFLSVSAAEAQPKNLCMREHCSLGGWDFIQTVGADGVEYQYLIDGKLTHKTFKPDVDINGVYISPTKVLWAVGGEGKVFRKSPDNRKWKEVSTGKDVRQ